MTEKVSSPSRNEPSLKTLTEHAELLANKSLLAKSEIEWRAQVLAKAFLAGRSLPSEKQDITSNPKIGGKADASAEITEQEKWKQCEIAELLHDFKRHLGSDFTLQGRDRIRRIERLLVDALLAALDACPTSAIRPSGKWCVATQAFDCINWEQCCGLDRCERGVATDRGTKV